MVFILPKQTSLKGGFCSEQYHNKLERFGTREKLIGQGVFIKLKKIDQVNNANSRVRVVLVINIVQMVKVVSKQSPAREASYSCVL